MDKQLFRIFLKTVAVENTTIVIDHWQIWMMIIIIWIEDHNHDHDLRTKHYHNVVHWYEASLSRGKPQKPQMMVLLLPLPLPLSSSWPRSWSGPSSWPGWSWTKLYSSASNNLFCERAGNDSSYSSPSWTGVLHQPGINKFIFMTMPMVMVRRNNTS